MTYPRRPGMVRAEGARLVDDAGPVLLRGVGLGNWLLPEGYMWRFGDELSAPRQIERRIARLIGPEAAADFWRGYRDVFVAEADFALIAELGFDHVRLPINSRDVIDDDGNPLEAGFALIERAVLWSERFGLRILLDLHGAPGGQTGTNIDDSPNGRPELFMDPRYRRLTVALWTELARRYRDREAVLGYDLLNEPLPNEWQHRYHAELVELYRELTRAIRAVDDRHLIMYEGSHWATNPEAVSHRFDDNQAVQFHRYWCPPDRTSIADFLALRDRIGSPVYMGEGGENTPAWTYAATRLYERHDIGWNFWPWKKLDTLTSPLSVVRPAGWELIADPAATPTAKQAQHVLDEFLRNVAREKCEVRGDVVGALFARPSGHLPAWAGLLDGTDTSVDRLVDGPIPEGLWHHTDGRPYDERERLDVTLRPGQTLRYRLAEQPREIRVDAAPAAAARGHWERGVLTVTALEEVRVRGVGIGR